MSDYVLLSKQQQVLPSLKLLSLSSFLADKDLVADLATGPFGLDFEANTYDWKRESFWVRSAAFCNDNHCVAVDLLGASESDLDLFWSWCKEQSYIAHNVQMEGGTLWRKTGSFGKPLVDTYVVFADLAAEYRRPWSLAVAMQDLLGLEKDSDAIEEYKKENKWTWEDVEKFDFEVLGKYNAIDAFGTWALYKYFDRLTKSYSDTWGPYYWDYIQQDFMNGVKLQILSRACGIHVDMEEFKKTYEEVSEELTKSNINFCTYPTVAPFIAEYNKEVVMQQMGKEPALKKNGERAKRWFTWKDKVEKMSELNHFNINSDTQLIWLLFDKLNLKPVEYTEGGLPSTGKKSLPGLGIYGKLIHEFRTHSTHLRFLTQLKEEERGILYPFVKYPGTVTGRPSGGLIE